MQIEHAPVTGKENKHALTPPMQALAEFYQALNSRDIEQMARNWAQTPEAVMDNPLGGIKRGWEDIRAVYEQLFRSPSQYHFEFYDYSVHAIGEMFYVVGRERGEFRANDTVLNMAIRTTRVFRLIEGRWQQVHHHGSIDDPDLLSKYQKAVRTE